MRSNEGEPYYIERLKAEGRFWIGADVGAAADYMIPPADPLADPPFSITHVSIDVPQDAMPFTDLSGRELFECLRDAGFSMRSRGAQAGLMVVPGYINGSGEFDDGAQEIVHKDGKVRVTMPLLNFGARAVEIHRGQGIGGSYHKTGARELQGSELVRAIEQTDIHIGGDYGRDWWYVDKNFQRVDTAARDRSALLALALSRDRLRTTPGPPVAIFDEGIRDYRGYLQEQGILVPVKQEEYPTFWITQTATGLMMPPGYTGVLSVVQLGEGVAAQIMSLLVKGGQTPDWPIVVEVVMPDGQHVDASTSYDGPEKLVPVDFIHDPMSILMEVWKDRKPLP